MIDTVKTRIKICGVTRAEDVLAAAAAGAHCIGINFYPQSSRFIGSIERAGELADVARKAQLLCAGVFVNAEEAEISSTAREVRLNIVQLHGDESAEFCAGLAKRLPMVSVWKALRVFDDDTIFQYMEAGCSGVLFDANVPGAYGGTGKTFDWATIPKFSFTGQFIVSGGLTPENVAESVRVVRPGWVDTASGVESSPGIKDIKKLRAFCAAVQNPKS